MNVHPIAATNVWTSEQAAREIIGLDRYRAEQVGIVARSSLLNHAASSRTVYRERISLRDRDVVANRYARYEVNLTGIRAGIVLRHENGTRAERVAGFSLDILRVDGRAAAVSARGMEMQSK